MADLPLSRALGRKEEPPRWLSRKEAAAFLNSLGFPIAAGTLAQLAKNDNEGKGPPFTRYGWKTIRYEAADLRAWAADKTRKVV